MSSHTIPPIALNTEEAAHALGLSPRTLANWRSQGRGPRYAHLTNDPRSPVMYPVKDLEEWVDERLAATR